MARKTTVARRRFEPCFREHGRDSLLDCAAMKAVMVRTLCIAMFLATRVAAQDVIPLYPGLAPGSAPENYPEKAYFSKTWNTEVVANVTKPSLTVFKPSAMLPLGFDPSGSNLYATDHLPPIAFTRLCIWAEVAGCSKPTEYAR